MARRVNAFDFAASSAVAAASTMTTLWFRWPMLGITSAASAAERQTECTRMVDEKAAAMIEGSIAASMEMYRAFNGALMGQFGALMNAPLAITNASLRPAFRRVNANARRLQNRS